jgi:hypothetical protein
MARGPYLQNRFEFLPTVIYIGVAARGEGAGDAVWTIKKIDLNGDGDPIRVTWTDTTAVWDNRADETYT